MAFVDECKILFKAGDGGNGIVAWRREAHVPLGGPAGGDGGNGGSIILKANHNENSLQTLKFSKHIKAKNGDNGQIKTMHGKSAADVIVSVPVGTIVYDLATGQQIADISEDGQEFMVCKGGKGGFGNFHFKSGMNKNPSLFELGDLGEEKECKLVLKQIADIGIIGLPNAGKSTFISNISSAKPKTANYQFTTLIPVLGTIYKNNQKVIFADIPGLIEGASQGLGLGHDFLKHIERTKVLIHLISMDDEDALDPIQSYETIMSELKMYSPELLEKPMLVVANKMDATNANEKYEKLANYLNNPNIIKACTGLGENLNQIVDQAYQLLCYEREKDKNKESVQVITYQQEEDVDSKLDRTLNISQIADNVWSVECEFLKYWARKIPLTTQDNIVRFNQKMKTALVEETLANYGAKQGDIIKIFNVEMVYEGY